MNCFHTKFNTLSWKELISYHFQIKAKYSRCIQSARSEKKKKTPQEE